MKKGNLRSSALLLLTACIWGVAFVAQSVGMEYVGPFTFNFVRSILGGLVLIPCIFFLNRGEKNRSRKNQCRREKSTAKNTADRRDLLWYRTVPGNEFPADRHPIYNGRKGWFYHSMLYCDRSGDRTFYEEEMQSDDLAVGASGSCGFVSALHKRTVFNRIRRYSGICLCDSVSVHILIVDYFSPKVDGVEMSCIQFLVCGLLSGIAMLFVEQPQLSEVFLAWKPIAYAGIMSCGVGYTLQIVGQKGMDPTIASLILSLESCISVLAGWLLLGQTLSIREGIGCVAMFAAIILAQLPAKES